MNNSTDKIVADTRKKIDELYSMSGYMDKYGKDVWISAILCIIFIILICYYYIVNVLEVIKSDWPNQKCNPLFMPFAGFINKPTNQSNLEFTAENFTGCIMSILEYITLIAFEPFQIILKILTEAINSLVDSFNKMKGLFDKMRTEFANIFDGIYAAMSNLMVAFLNFMVKLKDTLAKMNGVLTTVLFTLYGAYMAMESLFLSMLDLVVLILIIIALCIILNIYLAMGLNSIPIIGPIIAMPNIIIAIVTTIIMIIILILVIWFMIMMMRVLKLSSPPPPGVPGCFAEGTLIPLFESGKAKFIKDIQLGDKLKNGGVVTATIQFSATEQHLYMLNEVMVTGEHRVFHPTLKWIKVKNHPESRYIRAFTEPYVYCLNTDNKEFIIGDTLFSDWDDIDTNVLNSLQKNCVSTGYLPDNFNYADIHIYLESGFHPDTTVKLNNGSIIPIRDVKVNDILENNTKVFGVIKIQGKDIELYKHSFNNKSFLYGSRNIHIDLDILSEPMLSELMLSELMIRTEDTPNLYHLLTDTKFFTANNIKVHDYNYGIDVYLN